VSITISADDPRSIRAIEIAANAGRWRVSRDAEGGQIFRVPSQSQPGILYLVTEHTCSCADFLHSADTDDARACKHILAVRLYCELVKAQHGVPGPRRNHLRLVR
jgi:predicted nucleic acid-binding Zn finger protein